MVLNFTLGFVLIGMLLIDIEQSLRGAKKKNHTYTDPPTDLFKVGVRLDVCMKKDRKVVAIPVCSSVAVTSLLCFLLSLQIVSATETSNPSG